MTIETPATGRPVAGAAPPDAARAGDPADHHGPSPDIDVVGMRPAFQRNALERRLSRAHGAALCGAIVGGVLGLMLGLTPGPLQAGSAYGAVGYGIVLGLAACAGCYAFARSLMETDDEAQATRRRVDARIREARRGGGPEQPGGG